MRKRLIATVLCVQMLLSLLASTSVVFASEIVSPSTDEPVQENSLTKTDSTSGEDESTPGEGEGTPGEGEGTPGEGEGIPGKGESAFGEGEDTPGEGEGTPSEGESTSGEGEGTPGKGESTFGEGEGTPGEGESTFGEGKGTPSGEEGTLQTPTIPVKELTWLSYEDALMEEACRVWIDPSIYIGYTATFNTTDWIDIIFANIDIAQSNSIQENTVISISNESLTNIQVEIKNSVIADYYYYDDDTPYPMVWYEVEILGDNNDSNPIDPQILELLEENPYVLYHDNVDSNPPTLLIQPKKAMFVGETVEIRKAAAEATKSNIVDTADLPDFVDVIGHTMLVNQYQMYDIGDLPAWNPEDDTTVYRYVKDESLILIPPEVTVAYEKLLQAEDMDSYNAIYNSLPEYVRQMFSEKHLTNLEKHTETLANREYTAIVELNGKTIPVSVRGPLPAGASLSVTPVSGETILNADFDIHSATEIIAALDIRIVFDDNTEWQPADGQYVAVSIGMTELGYEDGDIVRLHHQHEGDIFTYNVFVVLDGCVTYWTNGFSIYVVSAPKNTTPIGQAITPDDDPSLEVGQEIVYYRPSDGDNGGTYTYGTWTVEDSAGAIYHTVHSNGNPSSGTMSVPWIKINALKVGTVTLRFYSNNSNTPETYTLNITAPKAAAGQKRLYIQDIVNTDGIIKASLVDDQGNELSLAGASFSWRRSDNLFIVPQAYTTDYSGVNIAVDHAGLVEARKDKNTGEYDLVTYTVKAILADGDVLEASYTVYYQSEIINANFEAPNAPGNSSGATYTFFPNGYDGLYWKTTAPGTGDNRTKDIEYGDLSKTGNGSTTEFGVTQAADAASGGTQFAELNAEAFGALYQDIITAPGEDLDWSFSHAARPNQNWGSTPTVIYNQMYIVIGPTEAAQKLLTQEQLSALGNAAKSAANVSGTSDTFLAGTTPVDVTYDGAKYKVWYHNAGGNYLVGTNTNWTKIADSYTVPNNQYRTRIFFVSDPPSGSTSQNAGNLIDASRAGQYKKYLIEYYEETIENGIQNLTHLSDYDEIDERLIYSSALIKNLDSFVNRKDDNELVNNLFLHQILVNGVPYPYDIRYDVTAQTGPFDYSKAAIYITKYLGTPTHPIPADQDSKVNDYSQYDIVLQVFLRDTIVSVDKELVFPAEMTIEQKQNLMKDLTTANPEQPDKVLGYNAEFELHSIKATRDTSGNITKYELTDDYIATGDTLLTILDPSGDCTGYVSIEKIAENGGRVLPTPGDYVLEETATSELVGLVLETVELTAKTFSYNNGTDEPISQSYTVYTDSGTDNPDGPPTTPPDLVSLPFTLEAQAKIAQVSVVNTYREKLTKINYKAIGNGKVKLNKADANYEDTPSETLKFYSGKAIGAVGHAAKNATFVGWFLDEACTQEVPEGTSAYGVYNKAAHTFKPNANIISEEVITFYALFETGTITIERTNAEPGQVFVYHIHRDEKTTTTETETGTQTETVPALDMYVTVVCGNDGTGSTTVYEVPLGEYTVTELPDFAWRYDNKREITKEHEFNTDGTVKDLNLTYKFGEDKTTWNKSWLNDFDTKPNVSKRPKPTGGSD